MCTTQVLTCYWPLLAAFFGHPSDIQWHPTHSNRLRIGAGLGHQNTCCQLCWGAVDAVRCTTCTTLAPGEVEDLQVELLKAQAGCDVHHVFISSTKGLFARSRKGNAVNLRWNVKTWRLVVGGAGGWWSWWSWLVYLGCLALFLSRWNWRCGRDKSWHQSRRVELHRGSHCGWLMCISRCSKSRENNRIQ